MFVNAKEFFSYISNMAEIKAVKSLVSYSNLVTVSVSSTYQVTVSVKIKM